MCASLFLFLPLSLRVVFVRKWRDNTCMIWACCAFCELLKYLNIFICVCVSVCIGCYALRVENQACKHSCVCECLCKWLSEWVSWGVCVCVFEDVCHCRCFVFPIHSLFCSGHVCQSVLYIRDGPLITSMVHDLHYIKNPTLNGVHACQLCNRMHNFVFKIETSQMLYSSSLFLIWKSPINRI